MWTNVTKKYYFCCIQTFIVLVFCLTLGMQYVRADLNSVAYGVYGKAWLSWVLKNSEKLSLYVYQLDYELSIMESEQINDLANAPLSVFFVQGIHDTRKEKWMEKGASPDKSVEDVGLAVQSNFDLLERFDTINISLDEENFWWNGRGDYLDSIYLQLKATDRSINVWQFFAEGLRTQRRKDRRGRFQLGADGYIFDEYRLSPEKYEDLLLQYLQQGKPVISILWASPNWKPRGRKARKHNENWWDEKGWRSFFEKTMINRKHGVQTAYFMFDIGDKKDKFRLIPTFASNDVCSVNFVNKLFEVTLPTLFSIPVVENSPAKKPDWVSERCPIR